MTFAGFVVALVIGTIPGARGLGQLSASLPAAGHPQPPAPPPPQPPAGCPAGGFAAARRPWTPTAAALPRRGTAGRAPRGRRSSCALPGGGGGGRPGCAPQGGRGRAERGRADCERGERAGGRAAAGWGAGWRRSGGAGGCAGDSAGGRALAGRRRPRHPVAGSPSLEGAGKGGGGGRPPRAKVTARAGPREEFKPPPRRTHREDQGPTWFYPDAIFIRGKSR